MSVRNLRKNCAGLMLIVTVSGVMLSASEPDVSAQRAALAPYFQPPPEYVDNYGPYRSPLKFADGTEVKTPDDWQRRRKELLADWHESLGKWPVIESPPKRKVLEETRRENFTQQRVQIEFAPDRTLENAYLTIPEGPGPFPAVIVVFYEGTSSVGLGKSPMVDFGYQLGKRGFVTLSTGGPSGNFYPNAERPQLQPLWYLAFVASRCRELLAGMPEVQTGKIGIVGHSFGGKWSMFASCADEKFACAVWCDGGIVFDEQRPNVNYWEPWYIGHDIATQRKPGVPTESNPRTGPYKRLIEQGRDLHELMVLMAPRPFLVSGGSEDPPARWQALNHVVAVNKLLGASQRVAMTNRPGHTPTAESNEQIYQFLELMLKGNRPDR